MTSASRVSKLGALLLTPYPPQGEKRSLSDLLIWS